MTQFDLTKYLAEGRLHEGNTNTTTSEVEFEGETYRIELRRDGNYVDYDIFDAEGNDTIRGDRDREEAFMDAFDAQHPDAAGIYAESKSTNESTPGDDGIASSGGGTPADQGSAAEKEIKEIKTNKMKKSELKEIIKSALMSELDGAKNVTQTTEDVSEAEEVDVEDNEDIDVDIEKDVTIDDESTEADIDVKASVSGESEDVESIQGLLTKALEQAKAMGDEKLTDQIGNTITYFTRAHISNVSEADLDMELDPTTDTHINPEAAAVIGLDEEGEALNESITFPMWNKIK